MMIIRLYRKRTQNMIQNSAKGNKTQKQKPNTKRDQNIQEKVATVLY